KYIGIIGFPISAGVYFVAPQVTDLIYGASFTGSVKTLQVLGLTVCILFISNIIAYILTAAERVNHVTHANASSVLVNIALNFWFIPIWGGMGAALATLVCSIIKSAYIYLVFAMNFKDVIVLKNLAKPLLATCFMSAVLWSFPSGLAATILLGVISYGFFLIILRTFSRDEILMFRQMIPYPQVSR
ncbi:MAG: polysaccharide biosynthesis C-terminal domain-containing protein, partial [Deltaproteobacteria bacterium]|nr:polysaccharide biosynthesis C-terminal domain-containing protein [Deltaproteobacteria bacterium]